MDHDIPPNDKCGICESLIDDDWKVILEKSEFAQTWCITCVTNWIYAYPKTHPPKIKTKRFLKENGIDL